MKPTAGARTRLVADVAHEVGNLLAAIRLAAHLLPHAEASERARDARQVEQLAAQAGELLAQLRPFLGRARRRRASVPIGEVVAAVRRALEGAPGSERLTLAPLPRGLPPVSVDPDLVHHALLALCRGELAAAREGAVSLRAARRGSRVVLELASRGDPLAAPRRGLPLRGRELTLALADAVLRSRGGRVEAATRAGLTRIRVTLRVQ